MGIIRKQLYLISTATYFTIGLTAALWLTVLMGVAQQPNNRRPAVQDTSRNDRQSRRLLYSRWNDRIGNRFIYTPPRSTFFLKEPKALSNDFRLDTNRRISVYERIGDVKLPPLNYRDPLTMSYEDFQKLQDKRVFNYLWRDYSSKQDGKGALGARGLLPKLDLPPGLDRIFGSSLVDFKPNGFVLLDFGVLHQNIDNPQVPIRQRKSTNFLFNEQININFNGKIGDKLGMLTNFDTKSSFNFENQFKLDYRPGNLPTNSANLPNSSNLPNAAGLGQNGVQGLGQNGGLNGGLNQNPFGGLGAGPQNYIPENESIIQGIQAGNINWQIPSQLIPGVQNLFGAKVDLRFGRLTTTLVASQQRSKQQCITLRGGVQNRPFEIRADAYDENRHFFLSYFFRNNYERWLGNLPMIMSGVTITRLEVYVTNRTNNTETLRNIVGFSDLGESAPVNSTNPNLAPIAAAQPVNNKSNGLFQRVTGDNELREADKTSFALDSRYNLRRGDDYDLLRGARKLNEREYKFQPELGYISLLTPLRNDEILAVAYEYTLNGQKYKVGELTEDYQARRDDEVLVLKLLKSSTIRNNTNHPMWNLMMKNIYSLNTTQVGRQNFQMRVIYKDDLTGIDNPNLQEGPIANVPLLRVMGLDKLNPLNDPVLDNSGKAIGDGNFDFVDNVTIDSRFGRIIFPVLEPFGSNLAKQFSNDEVLANKYVFNELYRTTQIDAQQVTEKNKYFLKGSFQGSSGGAAVQLPFGVSEKSVTVRAGGVQLQQGIDYAVEGQSGSVRLINESVVNSGRDIEICYEQPDLFQNQIRRLFGTRLNYVVNRDMQIGMTAMNMRETPPGFLTRAALGNDPVNNSIIGADITFRKESRFLTKLLDKLPLLQTKEISGIQFQGEIAQSFAGLHPQVRNRIMVDDFESARTQFDLTRQPTRWRMGGTPQQFPQGTPTNPLEYAYNRAKISAYTIDITFSPTAQAGLSFRPNITDQDFNNFYERLFTPQDIFKGRGQYLVNLPENILDVAYFPRERGMYNFNTDLDPEGRLRNPRKNFGAITRAIGSDVDFDNANVEIMEFWLMDPFKEGPNGVVRDGVTNTNNTTGGKLYFNLGEISEDVVKNGRYDFENGLPLDEKRTTTVGTQTPNVAESAWGYSTRQQYIINAFTNEAGARPKQDIGLDGLSNAEERTFHQNFIQNLPPTLRTEARNQILTDPAGDDFEYYFSAKADSANKKIVERYKNFMGLENNTPEFQSNTEVTPAATNLPDGEDLNTDNTINDQEAYYEYEVDLKPGQLDVGKPYIVDKVSSPNGAGEEVNWYLFRIPVREFTRKVGNINGFKSIRFVRMYMTDWEQPVVLRFAQLQMVATQYRKYTGDLNARGLQEVPEPYDAQFKIATVSVEENSAPGNSGGQGRNLYTVPPGWQRDVDYTTPNQRPLNEQSMSLCVTNLRDGDSRAAFKNVTSQNLLFRERLKMFVHMQNDQNENGQVSAFMRLGTDVSEHYYEIEVTNLQATPQNIDDPERVWPQQNEIDIEIPWLIEAKAERDRQANGAISAPYTVTKQDGLGRIYRITVVGRPDLSNVMVIMIGMRNPRTDDQQPKTFCIWVNEMHVQGFDNQSGTAAIARADIKLADLGTVQVAGKYTTFGFGGVQQKLTDRSRDNTREFNLSAALALDKFLPEKWGFKIPLYVNYDLRDVKPHFNPYDPDTPLAMSLANYAENDPRRAQLENATTERAERRGFNFSNVRKTKLGPNAKRHFWDFENLSFTYAYNEQTRRSSTIADYAQRQYRGGIIYQYGFPQRSWEPFRTVKSFERPYLELLKDFNLSLLPTQVAIRFDADRSFIRTLYRSADLTDANQAPLFEKYFLFNRGYDLSWNLTKNVVLSYSALANAVVDEPEGDINTQTKQDIVWRNFKNLGRMKNFDQKIRLTYRLPLDKIPLLDWMTADYSHNIMYQFSPITSYYSTGSAYNSSSGSSFSSGSSGMSTFGGSNSFGAGNTGGYGGYGASQNPAFQAGGYRLTDSDNFLLGNILRNGKEQSIRGKVDFVKLYNKLRYLRFANNPSPPRKNFARSPGDDEDVSREPSKLLKNLTRLLMTVRGIDVDYTRMLTTTLPGFLPSNPGFWGLDGTRPTSLTGFIVGKQSPQVLYDAAAKGNLTKSTMLNVPFVQSDNRTFRINTRLEPFKDFRIQISAQLTRGDEYRMFYRVIDSTNRDMYQIQSPVRTGNFQMSFMSFRTAFAKINDDNSSPIFEQFKAYRDDFVKILTEKQRANPEYKGGEYNQNSQDVLIAAFFAAYNGRDPKEDPGKARVNPFLGFPLPNWRVDYNGLSQLTGFKKIFSSFTLEHSYQSTYSVGSFTSSLDYNELYTRYLTLDNRDYQLALLSGENGNAVPIFVMSTISLSEKFSPLIAIRARTQNKIDMRFAYNQDRNISLNLSNSQVAELFNRDVTITLGLTRNNVRIPFRINGEFKKLKNDLQFQCNFTIRDTRAIQRRFDEPPTAIAGNYNFQLRPQLSYTVSKLWSMQLYFDRTFNNPYVLNSFRRATTAGGIQVRFNVAEL